MSQASSHHGHYAFTKILIRVNQVRPNILVFLGSIARTLSNHFLRTIRARWEADTHTVRVGGHFSKYPPSLMVELLSEVLRKWKSASVGVTRHSNRSIFWLFYDCNWHKADYKLSNCLPESRRSPPEKSERTNRQSCYRAFARTPPWLIDLFQTDSLDQAIPSFHTL